MYLQRMTSKTKVNIQTFIKVNYLPQKHWMCEQCIFTTLTNHKEQKGKSVCVYVGYTELT